MIYLFISLIKKNMLVVNASNIQKDLNWIIKFNFKNAKISNFSDKYSMLASRTYVSQLQPLTSFDLSSLKYYNFLFTNSVDLIT